MAKRSHGRKLGVKLAFHESEGGVIGGSFTVFFLLRKSKGQPLLRTRRHDPNDWSPTELHVADEAL